MNQIMECVPNFSEGRNREVVEAIVAPFKANDRVKLLDVRMDEDHNRSVVTVIGEPEALRTQWWRRWALLWKRST